MRSWFNGKANGSGTWFCRLGRGFAMGACILFWQNSVLAQESELKELRVCADPYNLPFSNQEGQGFENKIAELFAEKLGVPLRYEWFPQRMGFIRNTLKAELRDGVYKCDLVMGVPSRFELAAVSIPYYASTWVLVYARNRGLDDLQKPEDIDSLPEEVRSKLRLGVFDRGPAQIWAFKHGMMATAKPYVSQAGDARVNPGNVVQDILDDEIDFTILWGPIGGYYAKQAGSDQLGVLPMLERDPSYPEMRFRFSIAMAVRHGEQAWQEQINRLIRDNREEMQRILVNYGLPLVELLPADEAGAEDDD